VVLLQPQALLPDTAVSGNLEWRRLKDQHPLSTQSGRRFLAHNLERDEVRSSRFGYPRSPLIPRKRESRVTRAAPKPLGPRFRALSRGRAAKESAALRSGEPGAGKSRRDRATPVPRSQPLHSVPRDCAGRRKGRPERSGRPFLLERAPLSRVFERLGVRGGVHPHDLPDIAVGILDAAVEHEAVILHRVGVGAAARGDGPRQRRIHGVAGVDAEREQRLALASRVARSAAA
jgi:hypothetical protein